MANERNAFRHKAADSKLIDTSQFITLVIPTFLDEIDFNELLSPQLTIIRGTPGIGKSTLLRLFETQTLITIYKGGEKNEINNVYSKLKSIGIFDESTIRKFGLYIHCDNNLKDLGAIRNGRVIDLTKTLLDIKISLNFIESIYLLAKEKILEIPPDWKLPSIPMSMTPPHLFAGGKTVNEFIDTCHQLERDFAILLNSFPDDPVPESLQPHARMYALSFIQEIISNNSFLSEVNPIIMMDDFQDLKSAQRDMIKNELIRRDQIPRWISVRNHIYGLEELIRFEGDGYKRDYYLLPIDDVYKSSPKKFTKLTSEIARQRLLITPALSSMSIDTFKAQLPGIEKSITPEKAQNAVNRLLSAYIENKVKISPALIAIKQDLNDGISIKYNELLKWEIYLIMIGRILRRNQLNLFNDELEKQVNNYSEGKVRETAKLSLSKKLGIPYYYGFDALSNIASTNIKQFLDTSAEIVEWMIGRAELNRDTTLSAVEQEKKLKTIANGYFNKLDIHYSYGSYIKTLIRNLGRLFLEITFLPNAPYAPGITGFSLPLHELRGLARGTSSNDISILAEVLKNAVAWNVLQVRTTHQGKKNSEDKQIFYFNRLLCVHFGLPLNYGSWRPLNLDIMVMMMKSEIDDQELKKITKKEEPEDDIKENESEEE